MKSEITAGERKNLNDFLQELEEMQKNISKCDYTHQKQEYFDLMRSFRKFLAAVKDKKLCDIFYHSHDYEKYRDFFVSQNNYYMRALEAIEAVTIMTKQVGGESSFVDLMDREYIRERYLKKSKEVKSLDFSKAKHVVMVGAGPMPETILYMFGNTNVERIIGLDNNQEAIYIAGEMVSSLGLDRIHLLHVDGLQYDYGEADIVYIAGFVRPKNDILARVADTAPKHVQILVDSPTYMLKMLFESVLESQLHRRLKIVEKTPSVSPYYRQEMLKIQMFDI